VRQSILQLDTVHSVPFDRLRWSTLVQKARVDSPQAFFEKPQPDNDDSNVDEGEVGDDGEDVDDQLLSKFQVLDIDGVQPALSTATDSEEKGINCRNVVKTREYRKGDQGTAENVEP